MNEQFQNELKKTIEKCVIWKDFFSSFKHLPNPFQSSVIKRLKTLTKEIQENPKTTLNYDRDMASPTKYFPNRPEILEHEKLFPFRMVTIKDELNKEIVTINFLSCYLVKKINLQPIICRSFCSYKEKDKNCSEESFDSKKICLISCSYQSLEDFS